MLDRAKNWVDNIKDGESWGGLAHFLRHSDDVLDTQSRQLSTLHTDRLGTAIRTAEASIYHPFIANHQTPVDNAFHRAKYDPKLDDAGIQKLFQQNDLQVLTNPESPFVDWGTYLGERNTAEMRTAIATMAKSLDQIPRELGFQGLPRYDVRSGTFFGQSLDAVGTNASKIPGQPDSLMASFLKGHREKLAVGPEALNNVPILSLYNSHVKQAAKQLAFQPFTQSPTGKITLVKESLYNDLVKAANDPTAPSKIRMAAEGVKQLLDGEKPTIADGYIQAAYHGWAANAIVNNLKVVGNSAVDYATLLGIHPKYQVRSVMDKSPVKAELLRQANITSNAQYLGNMLGQDGASFKTAKYDITSMVETKLKQEAYYAKMLAEGERLGLTPEQILKPPTEAAKVQAAYIKGEAMKAVRQTQGYGSTFNSLILRQTKPGSVLTFLSGAPLTTQGTLLGMGKRAAEQWRAGDKVAAVKSLSSLSYAMTVRTLLVGGRSAVDPKTAAALLEVASSMDTKNDPAAAPIRDHLIKALTDARDGTVTVQGVGTYTGFLQQLDNEYGTNLSAAVPSVVSVPTGHTLNPTQLGHKFTSDPGKASLEITGEAANALSPAIPTSPIQPRMVLNAINAASHIQEGKAGTRPYFGKEIPVNPTGEVISTFFGGPGPSGNTWQRRASEADTQLRTLQRYFAQQYSSGAWKKETASPDARQLAKHYLDNYGDFKYPNLTDAERKKVLQDDLLRPLPATKEVDEAINAAEAFSAANRAGTLTPEQRRAYGRRLQEYADKIKQINPEMYGHVTRMTFIEKAEKRRENKLK